MQQREKRPRPIYWILSDSGEDSDDQDVIIKAAKSKDTKAMDSKDDDANKSIILIASDDEDMDMEDLEESKDIKDTIIHDVQTSPGSAPVLHRQQHQHHRDLPPEDSFDEDDDDDTDMFYRGVGLEIPRRQQHKPPVDVDYVELMNRSYRTSQSQYLTYQQEILQQREKRKLMSSAHKGPQMEMPENVTKEEMEVVFAAVGRYTQELKPVDWDDIAKYANDHVKGVEMVLLRKTKSYECATTFNYSSGSVVDMVLKESTMKLAVANVATQDIYNRPGNLLLCDLNKGETRQLQGHEEQTEAAASQRTKTVNDIKLSYSQNFFISASDDHKTKIWDAETGELVNTLGGYQSRVNRVAVQQDIHEQQDIFATCSAEGMIRLYSLTEDGQVLTQQAVAIPGGRRCISSISFGHNYYWDVLAAGAEATDREGVHGQVAIYDANYLKHVATASMGYGRSGYVATAKRTEIVCGTSGRTVLGEDENGDGFLRVLDVKYAKEVQSAYSGHEDVNLVDFSPCARYIISCSNNNEVAVFDRRFLGEPALHRFHHASKEDDDANAGITSALWWPSCMGSNRPMLISGGGDGTVKLWDIQRATEDAEIWSLEANLGPVARVTASSSFEHLIVGGDTGAVSLFSFDHGIVSKYHEQPMILHPDNN
ncbi:hypothetical protein BG011_005131 [Mortierella polycephala]|uniref:WD40 repeat-like protein n=1 Tax=Mortierella polycephala TaxID=41804 RepID=A0A9P6QE82_9FUNG|nr:hypothetical protein BG011_005131 [Mortierella polycephala]